MISKTSLGGDAVKLTLSKFLTLCVGLVTSMLLARFRTLEEYGTYSQILLVTNLFSSIFMLGLPNSINYFLARCETKEESQKFLSVYYTLSTVLCLIMGGALVCAVPIIISYFDNPTIHVFIYFLAVYPWTKVISASVENVLVVFQKTSFLMLYRLLHSVCVILCVLITQWIGMGFCEYMFIYFVVEVVFALSVYGIVYYLSGKIKIFFSLKWLKEIFSFSLPLGMASIIGTLTIEMDKLMIGRLMDTEQLAIYSNASQELPMTVVATSITAVLLPKFSKLLKENKSLEAVMIWNVANELSLMFMVLVVAGIFTYAEDVMEILYSAKYLSGVSVFRVYTLILLLRVTYFGIILNAKGKTKYIMFCSIITLVLNAILNPILFLIFGIIGPAIATFLSIFIVALIQLLMTAREVGLPMIEVFPWRRFGMLVAINVLLGSVFYLIKAVVPLETYVDSIMESIVLGGAWTILYVVIVRKRAKFLWITLNEGTKL